MTDPVVEPYVGEIRMFAGNYAPVGWALCDGSLIRIDGYEVLFVLLGTTYGGDGMEYFGLPDMRGRVPLHVGQGAGLKPIQLGERAGAEQVTLVSDNVPAHSHGFKVVQTAGTDIDPTGKMIAGAADAKAPAYVKMDPAPGLVRMHPSSISPYVGTSAPVSIVQPYTAITYIIALTGIMP